MISQKTAPWKAMRQRLRNGNAASGTVSRRLREAGNLSGLHRRIGNLLTLPRHKSWSPLWDKDLFCFLGIFIMGAFGSCVLYRKCFHPDVILRSQLGFHDSPPGNLGRFVGAAFSRNSQLRHASFFWPRVLHYFYGNYQGFKRQETQCGKFLCVAQK